MASVLSIAFFGMLGVVSRYGIDRLMMPWNQTVPSGTFVINTLGCLAAGILLAVGEKDLLPSFLFLGLLIGFCGGFTTFSAYALQTLQMLQKDKALPALLYLTLSPAVGLLFAYMGLQLTRKFIS